MLDLRQKVASGRAVPGYDTTTQWLSGTSLTAAQNVDCSIPESPGSEYAVFVDNCFTLQAVTVDVYLLDTLQGSAAAKAFLFTSFSVPAASRVVKLISQLASGDYGVRLTLTPAAAVLHQEYVETLIREVG